MTATVILYVLIFLSDWKKLKKDKKGRRLFLLASVIGATLLILLMSDIKLVIPAVIITNILDFLGLHY